MGARRRATLKQVPLAGHVTLRRPSQTPTRPAPPGCSECPPRPPHCAWCSESPAELREAQTFVRRGPQDQGPHCTCDSPTPRVHKCVDVPLKWPSLGNMGGCPRPCGRGSHTSFRLSGLSCFLFSVARCPSVNSCLEEGMYHLLSAHCP